MLNRMSLFVILAIFSQSVFSQNLVSNGSFENANACPVGLNELFLCSNWMPYGTSHPSPDFFHSCSSPHKMGVPNNAFGRQYAKEGQAYVGLIAYLTIDKKHKENWKLSDNHREFIQTYLEEPLIEGRRYYAEFSVNLVEDCDYAIGNMGMVFTEDSPELTWPKIEFEYLKPQIQNKKGKLLSDTKTWIKISGEFIARGGEKVLTIGNFSNDENTLVARNKATRLHNTFRNRFLPKIAYYFIDDVKLVLLDSLDDKNSAPIVTKINPIENEYFGTLKVGEKIILENIYFEFDKAALLSESFFELDKLHRLLLETPQLEIQIEGHTDVVGNDTYNIELSQKRAAAVFDYLIKKGIDESRISYIGFGKKIPIASNNTQEGRAINRRVQFMILR